MRMGCWRVRTANSGTHDGDSDTAKRRSCIVQQSDALSIIRDDAHDAPRLLGPEGPPENQPHLVSSSPGAQRDNLLVRTPTIYLTTSPTVHTSDSAYEVISR